MKNHVLLKLLALAVMAAMLVMSFACVGAFAESETAETAETTETADGTEAAEGEEEEYDDEFGNGTLQEEISAALADIEEKEAVAADGDTYTDSNVLNILLIGTDERDAEFSDDARGDTIMLFSIDVAKGTVKLVSFERGMGVPVLDGEYQGQWDWLTHTFKYGGADLMVREIAENFKLDVSKYVRVNCHSFMNLVDALGGVDIELTSEEAAYINTGFGRENARDMGVSDQIQPVSEGMNTLNGATAMVYARCRKIDSDWHRVERQRNVIVAAIKKLQSMDAASMAGVLIAMIPYVQTNINAEDLTTLANYAPTLTTGLQDVSQITIPQEGTYGGMIGMEGRSMYSADFNQNAQILKEFLYDVQ